LRYTPEQYDERDYKLPAFWFFQFQIYNSPECLTVSQALRIAERLSALHGSAVCKVVAREAVTRRYPKHRGE